MLRQKQYDSDIEKCFVPRALSSVYRSARAPTRYRSIHGKNGTRIIHGGTRKTTVCSSTFYAVNSKFDYRNSKNYIYIKITGMDNHFYILHHETLLYSILGHISPMSKNYVLDV